MKKLWIAASIRIGTPADRSVPSVRRNRAMAVLAKMPPTTGIGIEAKAAPSLPMQPRRNSQMPQEKPAEREAQREMAMMPLLPEKVVLGGEPQMPAWQQAHLEEWERWEERPTPKMDALDRILESIRIDYINN